MHRQNQSDGTPTVSRVIGKAIVELIYSPVERKTALVVAEDGTWTTTQRYRASSGEILVPYAPSNSLIRHECVLLPSEPADYRDKQTLLRDLEAYLHRYVDLTPEFERIAAHYVLLSWTYDAFGELPYLRFQGTFGSGKTRALIALGAVVYRGFFASAASTISPIFHTLDRFGGTLLLDEADLRYSDKTADLVKILNNGTVRGLPILRTLQNREKEFNPAAFNVFGPKIVAMRGAFRDFALESRFLTEEMGTRPLRSDIPIHLPETLRTEGLSLRNRLLQYRFANLFRIKSRPELLIDGVDPRLNQTAISLLSIVDTDETRGRIGEYLQSRQTALAATRPTALRARALEAIDAAFRESSRSFVSLREIAERINERDESAEAVTTRDIGNMLRESAMVVHKSHGTVGVLRRQNQSTN